MRRIRCGPGGISQEDLDSVAEEIGTGNLVVYPTETVYGIGASIYNEAAVKKLYVAKRRPFDMPLSVAVSDKDMARQIAEVDARAERLMDAFLPGPLTIIIKKKDAVPDIVTSMSEKVGIRIPDHPFALRLIRMTGPIVATSANLHSHPDAVTADEAMEDLRDSVSTYVDCGPCTLGEPSTIIWLMGDQTEIVRQGAITKQQIEDVLNAR